MYATEGKTKEDLNATTRETSERKMEREEKKIEKQRIGGAKEIIERLIAKG